MERVLPPGLPLSALFGVSGGSFVFSEAKKGDFLQGCMITHAFESPLPVPSHARSATLMVCSGMSRNTKHGERVMKRLFTLLAFLALSVPSAACAEWALVRGSDDSSVFASTARPTVAVKAAPGLEVVAQGKMTVLFSTERSLSCSEPGTVWYSLSAGENAQLAVALADAGSNHWYPGIKATNLEFLPILYACGSDKPGSVTQRVFIRPVHLDPWMNAFAAHGRGWTAGVLVSQYEWITNNGVSKLLVEYREPYASERCPLIDTDEVRAFVQRADTSFSARFGENGSIPADSVHTYAWGHAGISSSLLSTVLGTATEHSF